MPYLLPAPMAPPISERLSLLRARALLVACAEGPLPEAFGTTLHGALGRALKLTACALPDPARQPCAGCHLVEQCPYPRLFEPEHYPHTGGAPPPALLLAPSTATPRRLLPGSALTIDVVLAGQGIHALPLLLVVLSRMAAAGLGPLRVPCTIVRVDAVDAAGRQGAALQVADELRGQQPAPLSAHAWLARGQSLPWSGRVALDVRTRMRLQRDGGVQRGAPPFVDLVRALVRRGDAIARAYCGETDPFPDPRPWLSAAESVTTVEARLNWQTHERRSASTGHRMPLDGFTGTLVYAGDPVTLAAFLPLLALGEALGVGRGCSFGNGRYHLRTAP